MSYKYTPKRSLARPSLSNSTASTPNLSAAFKASGLNNRPPNALQKKSSMSALTSSSLANVPDASLGYGLRALEEDSPTTGNMPPFTPSHGADDDLEVGDLVSVPGNMTGIVRFVGSVNNKKGIFAGVELSEEFASRGKNNGDVDG